MTKRGLVLPLSTEQIVTRANYLAGKVPLAQLDPYVRRDAVTLRQLGGYVVPDLDHAFCPDLFYLLKDHNGGKDPCAPDPADRWSKPGSSHVNRTVDCSGGDHWMEGTDRFQRKRQAAEVGYGGWFNTDSKIIDARRIIIPGSGPRCYESVARPEPGAIIVCRSGSRGHAVGHEGRIVAYRGAEWDPMIRECWALIDVVDCSASGRRANNMRTGSGWYDTAAMFLRSVMEPDDDVDVYFTA